MEGTIFLNFGICVIWWETHLFCPIAGRRGAPRNCNSMWRWKLQLNRGHLTEYLKSPLFEKRCECSVAPKSLFIFLGVSAEWENKQFELNYLCSNMKDTIVFELPRCSHTNTRTDFYFIQDRSIPCFAHITLIPMSAIIVTNRKKTSYKHTSKPLTESASRKRFVWFAFNYCYTVHRFC